MFICYFTKIFWHGKAPPLPPFKQFLKFNFFGVYVSPLKWFLKSSIIMRGKKCIRDTLNLSISSSNDMIGYFFSIYFVLLVTSQLSRVTCHVSHVRKTPKARDPPLAKFLWYALQSEVSSPRWSRSKPRAQTSAQTHKWK